MTDVDEGREPESGRQDEERPDEGERSAQEAHGGSMAPGLVDDTGHAVPGTVADPTDRP
jgi:hypothetical protein